MKRMNIMDYLFLYALISTWWLLLLNIFLTISGYIYNLDVTKNGISVLKDVEKYPTISVLIPAHNEEKVIGRTLKAVLSLDYPTDKIEVIVINDNSTDNTKNVLEEIKYAYADRNIKVITTDSISGGKGKSNALNIGFNASSGEFIVVYDADNTPEKLSLRYLVSTIVGCEKYGAVIGKFRTRNRNRNWLTRFINIETLSFQWMAQAGRWKLLRICTIPGTNFIVRRSVMESLGGWDPNAIAEDTEISFRIYNMGYQIAFMPLAVTWEQEPETLKVWFKQRTRWANGNIYVLAKYFKEIFSAKNGSVLFDLYYFFSIYILFLSSVLISDVIFLLGLFTDLKITLSGNFIIIWILSYVLFVLEVSITLTLEKGESNYKNIFLVTIMYFTYCQLWIVVAIKGMIGYLRSKMLKRQAKWYKTERF
ncbi:glycosyltransferase family 2 protein [Crassaminicella thermophila]|uniref:Glycosyltransferase family 2 protein n=1 Tax=Crassaminicella thermophila TaxID=2599308 RepID=A0A5C0SFZ1_CRATE|nr:glycosyltransferase family 2 protein [Crassaminicella thermophila]QEK12842.1 glycosyltransferase family 2 protein [Crassaminicella thermophila]